MEKDMCVQRQSDRRELQLQRVTLRVGSRTNREGFIQQIAIYYRGRLTESGHAVDGPFDISFWLHEAPGARITPVIRHDVMVVNGVFSVVIDFDGVARLREFRLSVGVRRSAVPSEVLRLFPQDRLWP
jgi:hypothetical protein